MAGRVARLEPGARILFDGDVWTVAGIVGPAVHLRGQSTLGVWLTAEVVGSPDFKVLAEADGGRPALAVSRELGGLAALDAMSDLQRRRTFERLEAVLLLSDGHIPGKAADPELAGLTPERRVPVLAARYGVDERTIRDWRASFRAEGVAGLVDQRARAKGRPIAAIDARYRLAIETVLARQVPKSKVSDLYLIELVEAELDLLPDDPENPLERRSGRTVRRYLDELRRGRGAHLSTKTQRSIANRPQVAWGRAFASRLGELVLIDSTPLDCHAMDPVSGAWQSVHLTIALDLCTRSLLAWRYTPGAPTAADATMLLRDVVTPKQVGENWPVEGRWRYAGVPVTVVVGLTESDPVIPVDGFRDEPDDALFLGVPCVVPDAVIVDHGKIFISQAFSEACLTLGINLQLGRPYTPTDKAHVERVFDTIKKGFVQRLRGYKGPDLWSRGAKQFVEDEAFYFIDELNERFAAWVAIEYQNAPHDGLALPSAPTVSLSPNQAVDISVAAAGYLPVPVSRDLTIELLPTEWRTVRNDGIECNGLMYDQPNPSVLAEYRNRRSPYASKGGGWRIKVDPRDLSRVWFFDFTNPDDPMPGDGGWVAIPVKGWPPGVPFTDRTLAHAKRIVAERGYTHRDREVVVAELRKLVSALRWGDEALTRREKQLAALEEARAREARADASPLVGPVGAALRWDDPDGALQSPPPKSRPSRARKPAERVQEPQQGTDWSAAVAPFATDEIDEFDAFDESPDTD